jgi:hypothetical protein
VIVEPEPVIFRFKPVIGVPEVKVKSGPVRLFIVVELPPLPPEHPVKP